MSLSAESRIAEIIAPTIASMGYNLVQVKFGDGKYRTLQVMVENKDGGANLDDCARISRSLSAILDVEDIIRDKYNLEVTSPGIDRPLLKLNDYARFCGKNAKITIKYPVDGRKRFSGEILEVKDGKILMRTIDPPEEVEINFSDIESGKLAISEGIFKKKK